jgi:hypothetical protein
MKTAVLTLAIVFISLSTAAKDPDPSQYPETITVVSSNSQSQTTGATVRDSSSVLFGQSTTVRTNSYSYADIIFTDKDTEYEVTGYALLQPGEYKMRFDKNWVEILVADKMDKVRSLKYRVVGVSSIPSKSN